MCSERNTGDGGCWTIERGVALQEHRGAIATPAFVYDEAAIDSLLDHTDRLRAACSCRVLYSLKPFSFVDVLSRMAARLDGFAVSSPFEARLARQITGDRESIHMTTPGMRREEVREIGTLCDYVSFNSLHQWDMYHEELGRQVSCGLRVNPQLSFVDDDRYNPCRPHSKLGVPLEELAVLGPGRLAGLEGLLLHSNCESTRFSEIHATVMRLHAQLGELLQKVKWINLGGGYLFDGSEDVPALYESVEFLRSNYGLEVFLEPGAALIQSAGYIVSRVLDVFSSEGKRIAVLDTSVNHMPEVFEYGYEPDIVGHDDDAPYEYLLAGCTCLAGDLFGEYRFAEPLEVGKRVVFSNAGAYTLSKAHMFNGVNLPTIYAITEGGDLVLKKGFSYADFAGKWGADANIAD